MKSKPKLLLAWATTLCAAALWADSAKLPSDALPADAGPSSAPTTEPASAPAVDPAVMKILQDLQTAGQQHTNLRADIDYRVEQLQTGDDERRTGYAAYQRPTDEQSGKFRISFEKLKQGQGPWTIDKVDYAMDGQWLYIARHSIKQLNKQQVAPPGERVDAFKLGKGPFPLPFGQNAQDVIEYFETSTREPAAGDPKDSVYLKLIPRRQHRDGTSFVWAEMWIDMKTYLPVKLVSQDKSKNRTTVVFENFQTDLRLEDKVFSLPRPPGWELVVQPLQSADK